MMERQKHNLEYSQLTIKCKNTGKYATIRQTRIGHFLSELFGRDGKRIDYFIDWDFETIVIRSRVWVKRIDAK